MIGVIETTGESCSVAVIGKLERSGDQPRVLAASTTGRSNSHDRLLAEMFAGALDLASVRMEELEGVAVAIGPGSYTGIRIGISFAIGIGLAADLPLIPVSVLDAIAWRGRELSELTGKSRLLSLVPDRRGDVYAALYNFKPRFQRLTAPYNVPVGDIPDIVDENVIVAGPGAPLIGDRHHPLSDSVLPLDGVTIGLYGFELMRRGLCVEPHQVKPLYVGEASVSRPTAKVKAS